MIMRQNSRAVSTALFAIGVLSIATLLHAVEHTQESTSEVKFYGSSFLPPNLAKEKFVVSADFISDLVCHMFGIPPVTANGAAQAPGNSKFSNLSRPKKMIVVIQSPSADQGANLVNDAVALPFATDSSSKNSLVESILARASRQLSLTQINFNSNEEFSYLMTKSPQLLDTQKVFYPILVASGVQKADVESSTGGIRHLDLGTIAADLSKLPQELTEDVSLVKKGKQMKFRLLNSTATEMEADFALDNPCLPILLSELSSTVAAFQKCLDEMSKPSVCVVAPSESKNCLRGEGGESIVQTFVDLMFSRIANRLAFNAAANHSILAVSIATPIASKFQEAFKAPLKITVKETVAHGSAEYLLAKRALQNGQQDDQNVELANTNTTSSTAVPPDNEIPEYDTLATNYQITLWVVLSLVIASLGAVYSIHSITYVRDPMLYTKVSEVGH